MIYDTPETKARHLAIAWLEDDTDEQKSTYVFEMDGRKVIVRVHALDMEAKEHDANPS